MDMSLRELIIQRASVGSGFKLEEVKQISEDVARGLNYLHSRKPDPILHRDISSVNVLLSVESGGVRRAKISDYGSTNFMDVCKTQCPGAALYAAPEASQAKQDQKVI